MKWHVPFIYLILLLLVVNSLLLERRIYVLEQEGNNYKRLFVNLNKRLKYLEENNSPVGVFDDRDLVSIVRRF